METEDLKRTPTKQVLRKSGKRIDNIMMNSSSEFISAPVSKEGMLCHLSSSNKWKPVYFVLCGSMLYWKNKETSTAILGEIFLKDAIIEKLTVLPKSNFVIKITKDDKLWQISTEKETVCDEWINELIQNAQKPPSIPLIPTNRKETRILRAQKKVGGTIATSAPGKKIIREALGTEGYKSISIVKKIVDAVDGKKKAKEVEELLIRLGVKIILLAKNKEITLEVDDITKTLSRCFSPKNMSRFAELHTYLSSAPVLDKLFIDPNMRGLKKEWHYLMKNVSSQLDWSD